MDIDWHASLMVQTALAAVLLLICCMSQVHARESEASAATWTVAPYAWAPNLRGSVGIEGLSVPIDVRVEELAGSVKAGAMGDLRRIVGRHVIYAEGLGVDFEDGSLDQFRNLPVQAKIIFAEAGYGYRIPMRSALPNGGIIHVTPYVGLRYAQLDVAVTAALRSLAADDEWLDPALGVLVEGPVRGRMEYAIKIDGAGFGLGRDRYASGLVALTYRITDSFRIGAGYRLSRFHAEPGGENDLELKLTGSGPKLGLAYSFGGF